MTLKVNIGFPDGKLLPLAMIEHDHATRTKYLARYHGNAGDVICLCRREGIPMGVGRRQVPVTVYYLYPLHRSDPARHALGCPHRVIAEPSTTGESKTIPVIEIDNDKVRVNLGSPLYRGGPAASTESADKDTEHDQNGARNASPRGRLNTLIEVIWSEAELNIWRPWFAGKRHYSVVAHRIKDAANHIQVRKRDLAPVFYVPPPFSPQREELVRKGRDEFLDALCEQNGRSYFGFVMGLLRGTVEGEGEGIGLRLAQTSLRLWLNKTIWHRAVKRWFPGGAPDSPAVVLARVLRRDGRSGPWLAVEELTVMPLCDETSYIPVDSSFERDLALKLVAEKRQFRKPLSSEVSAGEILPDFILEDRDDRTCLEVLGRMTDPEYRTHAVEKRAWYERNAQTVWWWDTDLYPTIPTLPPADNAVNHRITKHQSAQDVETV